MLGCGHLVCGGTAHSKQKLCAKCNSRLYSGPSPCPRVSSPAPRATRSLELISTPVQHRMSGQVEYPETGDVRSDSEVCSVVLLSLSRIQLRCLVGQKRAALTITGCCSVQLQELIPVLCPATANCLAESSTGSPENRGDGPQNTSTHDSRLDNSPASANVGAYFQSSLCV